MPDPILSKLIPCPRQMTIFPGSVALDTKTSIRLAADFPEALELTEKLCNDFFHTCPMIEKTHSETLPEEAYRLDFRENTLALHASAPIGLLHAFKTLRQLAEASNDEIFRFPQVQISDAPALPFRGIHFCIFPETSLIDLEKNIRLAAYHKFNYAILEFWGTFPFLSHPEFGWQDRQLNREQLKKLIRLGKELGIAMIPQLNLLGHASAARAISGKHAVLYRHPELEVLFEPSGWSWCISNPRSRNFLTEAVLELHQFFEKPEFFHVGCDEAEDLGSCLRCREHALPQLLLEHLEHFHQLLKKLGCRMIMWHDMLLQRNDPRWLHFVANGKHEQLQDFHKSLPKDILLADWEYGIPPENQRQTGWPTTEFFQKDGFETLLCPWDNESDMLSMANYAEAKQLPGILVTTWHQLQTMKYNIFKNTGACAAWNPKNCSATTLAGRLALAKHLTQVCWDMKLTQYESAGYVSSQIPTVSLPNPLL